MDNEPKPVTRETLRVRCSEQYTAARRMQWDEIAELFLTLAIRWKLIEAQP